MVEARVVVFAKAPVLGAVKTRLAATIGPEAALAFYRTTLQSVVGRLVDRRGWTVTLAVTPSEALDHPDLPPAAERVPQGEGDLGARMARFLAQATPERPVLVVGSDVPDLAAGHVEAALLALQAHALAVGPSPDGGYWLIGASRPPPPDLFRDVRWSSPHTMADTLANASGVSVERLMLLEDVDDEDAWLRHRRGSASASTDERALQTCLPLAPGAARQESKRRTER